MLALPRRLFIGHHSHSWRSVVVRFFVAAVFVLVCTCLDISLKIQSANSSQGVAGLASARHLTHSARLLVISPHPDDESLGCAGLIRSTVRAGGKVRVVFLTNGDGFRVAAERETRELRVTPSEFVQFGNYRRRETVKADSHLGLKEQDLTFLGYPDRGLVPMWTDYWNTPFTSRYTRASSVPYEKAYLPNAPYTGKSVLQSLVAIISDYRPTNIVVTHPLDDHPDHYAAFAFATAALEEIRERDPAYVARLDLRTYLVHRGQWPSPRKGAAERCMAPPASFADHDLTKWEILTLSPADIAAKDAAINSYKSQTAIMGSFLRSFGRRNELFGAISEPAIPVVRTGAIRIDGDLNDWKTIKPQIEDPTSDNLSRALREGADLKALWLAQDSENLYLRVDTARKMPTGLRLRVLVRAIDGSKSEALPIVLTAPRSLTPAGSQFVCKANTLEARIPLSKLSMLNQRPPGMTRVWVGASTYYLGFNIDKTGWRPMSLSARTRSAARTRALRLSGQGAG